MEFALIAPFLFATILFIMSIGYVFLMSETLDRAVVQASRALRVGTVQGSATPITQTTFRTTVLCPLLPSLFSCDDVIVNIQSVPRNDSSYPNTYDRFVTAAQDGLIVPALDNSKTSYAPGSAQCVVYVQVLYPVSMLFGLLAPSTSTVTYQGRQVYTVMSTATFLTEPYSIVPSSC